MDIHTHIMLVHLYIVNSQLGSIATHTKPIVHMVNVYTSTSHALEMEIIILNMTCSWEVNSPEAELYEMQYIPIPRYDMIG